MKRNLLFILVTLVSLMGAQIAVNALPNEPHQPLPFLEGNPIWVYKYEHIPTPRSDDWMKYWLDTGDRTFTYYFLGGQKEIDGKVYTMMGEITSRGEENSITFNRWYPIREENGIVYTITDSLPGIVEQQYNEDYEIPYLQQGNECVLYNFGAKIGDKLDKNNTVKSFDSYQLMDGTECRVLKTGTNVVLYEKLGYRDDDGTYGLIDPLFGIPIATNGHAYVNQLNAFYLDNVMLYKTPDAQEGLCVNDTIRSLDDAYSYASSYKADPCQDLVFLYIKHLSAARREVNVDGLNYYLHSDTHEATLLGHTWSGELDIPSEVNCIGQTFIVKYITHNAFHSCLELTKVKIPKTLEIVLNSIPNDNFVTNAVAPYYNPFTGCMALESIEVDEENPSFKSVDGVLFSQDGVGRHYYQMNMIYGTGLYCYPAGLRQESYTIPENVVWIGGFAFGSNKYISKLTIPNGMQLICDDAFAGCSNLKDIYCLADDVPDTFEHALSGIPIASATLHVPAGSVEKYKAAARWNEFGNIVAIEPPVNYTKGQMATIILPTAPDAGKGKFYRLDKCEDGKIIFEQEKQPQPHIPYIIVPSEDFSIDTGTLDLAGLSPDTVSIAGTSFIGSYSRKELNEQEGWYIDIIDTTPDCGFSSSGETGKGAFIGALRAYLTVNWDDPINHDGSKGPGDKLEVVLKDNGTGLTPTLSKGEGDVYDLSGRQINAVANSSFFTLHSSLKKGIYIMGGKKIIR